MKTFAKLIFLATISLAFCQEDNTCNDQRKQSARQAAMELFKSDVSFLNNVFQQNRSNNNSNGNNADRSQVQMFYQMVSSMDSLLKSIQSVDMNNTSNYNNNADSDVVNQIDNIVGQLNSSNRQQNNFYMQRIVNRLEKMSNRLQSNSGNNDNDNNFNNNPIPNFGQNDCEKLLGAALDGLQDNARFLNRGLNRFNVMLVRQGINGNNNENRINQAISLTENFVNNMSQGLSATLDAGQFNSTFGQNQNKLRVLRQYLGQSDRIIDQLENRMDSDQSFDQIKNGISEMEQSIDSINNSSQQNGFN